MKENENESWMARREKEFIALGWKKGIRSGVSVTVPAPEKAKEAHLKKQRSLCIYFSEKDKKELREILQKLNYEIPKNPDSPVILHPDNRVTFIKSLASAILFHFPQEDFIRARPDIIRVDYEDIRSKVLYFCDLLSMGEHIE